MMAGLRYGLIGLGMAACLVMSERAGAMDSGSDNSGYGSPPAAAAGDSSQMTKARGAIAAKNWSGAIAILYRLAQNDPKNADAQNLLGFSYRMLGQYPQAFAYYDRALALDPMHKGALEYEGEAYLETNQLPKAEANLVTLKRACAAGCEELADLQGAVARYKAKARMN
jgi:tetratricopeptide (TPR) repeat protein